MRSACEQARPHVEQQGEAEPDQELQHTVQNDSLTCTQTELCKRASSRAGVVAPAARRNPRASRAASGLSGVKLWPADRASAQRDESPAPPATAPAAAVEAVAQGTVLARGGDAPSHTRTVGMRVLPLAIRGPSVRA